MLMLVIFLTAIYYPIEYNDGVRLGMGRER
jgi:hypothetical protein